MISVNPRRTVCLVVLVFGLGLGQLGCEGGSAPSGPAAPVVSTDLARLRTLVAIPPGVISARWLVRPLRPEGSRLVPGPTDTLLLAYLETAPTFWSEHGPLFGTSLTGPPQRVRAVDARVLLPAAVLQQATLLGDEYQLACDRLDPHALSASTQTAVMALHCASGILAAFRSQ